MSDTSWSGTELGEDTLDARERRRKLEEDRELLLREAEVDTRLIDFVWGGPSFTSDPLVSMDLTDVGWLDVRAVEGRPGLVPLCNLVTFEEGIGIRHEELVYITLETEEYIDTARAWELVLAPGLDALRASMNAGGTGPAVLFEGESLRSSALGAEMLALGGLELLGFAEQTLGVSLR